MYTFDDKKGRSLTLKPEGTAPAARAAIENGLLGDALPLKLCYVTNCYRYEAPQSGRYRGLPQFGAEASGAATRACDVELISFAYDLFTKLGIKTDFYKIEVNSTGCPDCRTAYQERLREYYDGFSHSLCGDCRERLERNPMRLIDCKNPNCAPFKEDAPVILDYNCGSCKDFFAAYKAGLDALHIPYTVNPRIVRGLDYYTNTVFEFILNKSGLVFGAGGRYNGLVKELGGAATPASGFALGLERIVSVMNETGAAFPSPRVPDLYIVAIGEAKGCENPTGMSKSVEFSLKLSRDLRSRGLWVECDIVGRSVKSQMRFADKIGARFTVVIGEDELVSGRAVLRNMGSKESVDVALSVDGVGGQLTNN
jgi:histidyl-tRNA synthetase